MKRSLLSVMLILTLLVSLFPVTFSVSAANDLPGVDGTIIVYNDTSTRDESLCEIYNTTGVVAAVSEILPSSVEENNYLVESTKLNPDGTPTVRINHPNAGARYYISDTSKTLTDVPEQNYDIYVYLPEMKTPEQLYYKQYMGLHARYVVRSRRADSNSWGEATFQETVYYVNQSTALNGEAGWYKLGTHLMSAKYGTAKNGNEDYVELKNDLVGGQAYAGAVAFVPVNRPKSVNFNHFSFSIASNANSIYDGNAKLISSENDTLSPRNNIIRIPAAYIYGSDGKPMKDRGVIAHFIPDDKAITSLYNEDGIDYSSLGWGWRYNSSKSLNAGEETIYPMSVQSADKTLSDYYFVSIAVDNDDTRNLIPNTGVDGTIGSYELVKSDGSSSGEANLANPTSVTAGVAVKSTEEEYKKKVNLYELGDHAKWTISDGEINAGLYSIYVNPVLVHALYGETCEVIVNHAGLRESVSVNTGKYHLNNEKTTFNGNKTYGTAESVYVGTFYFDGNGNETISVMNNSDLSLNDDRYELQYIEMASAPASIFGEEIDGVVISAGAVTQSATREQLAEGNVILPIAPADGKVRIKVIGSNSDYSSPEGYLKINGQDVAVNTETEISINEGENTVTVEGKSNFYRSIGKSYTFKIYGESAESTTKYVDEADIEVLAAPVSVGYAANKAGYVTAADGATVDTDGLKGTYRVMAWKPGIDFQPHSWAWYKERIITESQRDAINHTMPYSTESQAISINHSAGVANINADWSGADCRWVDLGTYSFSGAESEGVTFAKTADARPLVDGVRFIKVSDVNIDSAETLGEIENTLFEIDGTSFIVENTIGAEISVIAGDTSTSVASGKKASIELIDGFNDVAIAYNGNTYLIKVLSGKNSLTDDLTIDKTIIKKGAADSSGTSVSAYTYAYNKTDSDKTIYLVIALYGSGDTVCKSVPVTIKANTAGKIDFQSIVADTTVEYAKAFVWEDLTDIYPLVSEEKISLK